MKCPCGEEARHVVMNTFDYWYCPKCKEDIEVVKKKYMPKSMEPTQEINLLEEFERLVDLHKPSGQQDWVRIFDPQTDYNNGKQGADLRTYYYVNEKGEWETVEGGIER